LVLAGLTIDGYVHVDLANTYDPIKTSVLSQGDLFRAEVAEAAAAIAAAMALLFRPRRYTAVIAGSVAAAGFAAIMIYRYFNPGRLGQIPRCTNRAGTPKSNGQPGPKRSRRLQPRLWRTSSSADGSTWRGQQLP
jgi:hypothetical protein